MRKAATHLLGGATALGTTVAPPRAATRILLTTMELPVDVAHARAVGARAMRFTDEQKARRAEADARDARETGWVRDQLQSDIAEAGDPVELRNITHSYDRWTIDLLQWLPHGVGARVQHDVTHRRQVYGEDHDEAKLRHVVRTRFAKLLARQREFSSQWGAPRLMTADEIDLSTMQIERPVAAALVAVFEHEAGAALRKALASNQGNLRYSFNAEIDRKLRDAGLEGLEMEFGRNTVRGVFASKIGDVTIRWSKGGLSIFGVDLPESMFGVIPGRRVSEVIQHPLLDPDMKVTAAHPVRKAGRDGIALTIKEMTGPIPSDW